MRDVNRDLETEVARLAAELAECRRLLRKHRKADKHPETPGEGWCPECGSPGECDEGCAWEAAMKGGEA